MEKRLAAKAKADAQQKPQTNPQPNIAPQPRMQPTAGVAQGVKREFDTLFRTRAESVLRDLDVVQREEFEAVKDMARLAREENEALKARIAALEAKLGSSGQSPPSS